jgi:hypothetical protein
MTSNNVTFNFTNSLQNLEDKFKVDLEKLLKFIFPSDLQHPQAAGRLFAFAFNGPLDDKGQLRVGEKGKRVLMDYELEGMCQQFEREDIISIYLHKGGQLGSLTSREQENIISQADGHLKKAKGNAMLPRLNRKDIISLLDDLRRDEFGFFSFHEAQSVIHEFREERIKQYKLVYPSIASKNKNNNNNNTMNRSDSLDMSKGMNTSSMKKTSSKKRLCRVTDIVAPPTMFQLMQGQNNSDVIEQTTKFLSKHAYKISDIDNMQSGHLTSNIRLLREVEPRCKSPLGASRDKWSETATMKSVGLGSMVKCTSSKTTWKPSVTQG